TDLRGNRRAIVERLDLFYAREDRRPLAEGDLERLLSFHRLGEWFEKLERDNLRQLLRQQRGYLPPVAYTLRLSRSELKRLLGRLGLGREVDALRARAREEALAETELPALLERPVEKRDMLADL